MSRIDIVENECYSPCPIVIDNGDNESVDRDLEGPGEDQQCDMRKKPQGNKRANEDHKWMKIEQEAMKVSANAQREMAAANQDRVKTFQNNSLKKLLTLLTDNMEPELHDFVKTVEVGRGQEIESENANDTTGSQCSC